MRRSPSVEIRGFIFDTREYVHLPKLPTRMSVDGRTRDRAQSSVVDHLVKMRFSKLQNLAGCRQIDPSLSVCLQLF